MIAVQEELDWEVYRLYGLVDEDLTYGGDDLPGLALGERAFEIVLARAVRDGEEETAWFTRHGSTPITEIPAHWPAGYRGLVQRRLDVIESEPFIKLLEKPEYKRRWAQESWGKRQGRALRDGHCAASQALSANVFDTWLRDMVRRGKLFKPPGDREPFYGAIKRQIIGVSGKTSLRELKAAGSLSPVLMALVSFKPGGPVPVQLNRHATAHAAGPEQYSDVNAVIALMLTTSVLRQAQASGW